MQTVRAKDLVQATDEVAHPGERVGAALAEAHAAGQPVLVDLEGVKGVSSSFFNALLQRAVEIAGADAIRSRTRFRTTTVPQRLALDRSFTAVLGGG